MAGYCKCMEATAIYSLGDGRFCGDCLEIAAEKRITELESKLKEARTLLTKKIVDSELFYQNENKALKSKMDRLCRIKDRQIQSDMDKIKELKEQILKYKNDEAVRNRWKK